MTIEESNKQLIYTLLEATDKGDFEQVSKCYHENFIEHNPHSVVHIYNGRKGVEKSFRIFHELFPVREHIIEDILTEGNKVAARITFVAHPQMMFCPPLEYREYRITGTTIYRILEFQIIEKWTHVSVLKELNLTIEDIKHLKF